MAGLQTEYRFTLPKGYVDPDGVLHRSGTMRLATARDEIEPLRDQRVSGPDDPYLTILVLARVVTELGSLAQVTVRDVENLFAADLAFLQDLYGIINFGSPADVEALQRAAVGEPAPAPEREPTSADLAAPAAGVADPEPELSAEPVAPLRRRDRIEEVARRSES